MLILDRRSWLAQVFQLRGTTFAVTWKRVGVAFLVAEGVTYASSHLQDWTPKLTPLAFSLIGLALSIFLGFRNNTSYDRFWEGRKLWGRMVNVSRTFTRQVLTLVGPRMVDEEKNHALSADERVELEAIHRKLILAQAGYVHAFRHHLREEDALAELEGMVPPELLAELEPELNRPIAILQWMGDQLRALYDRGWIHPMHLPVLEDSLTEMTGVQGACERIKSTPIPGSYTVLMHRIVLLYCIGLPFGIVDQVGGWTPVVVTLVAYAFYGLEAVGTEIEDPFGKEPNDLPLSALSRMIEVNLRQRLGPDEALPPLLKPENGVLQ